jgi:hypothetical protein
MTRSVTCNDCGFCGSIREVELHDCNVHTHGGRCEDFPCCGHLPGECQNRPEFTSGYWVELALSFDDPADFDAYLDRIDMQGF